ncbi:MAG: hypothetical protein HC908_13590 [Calothrix sp. SM1_7_51]|nr:hypothetical protein [Calothrix sp. SM1_7_51]
MLVSSKYINLSHGFHYLKACSFLTYQAPSSVLFRQGLIPRIHHQTFLQALQVGDWVSEVLFFAF